MTVELVADPGLAPPTSRGPSPHLSWEELACHDPARTPYPVAWRDTRAVTLAEEFEAVRELLGGYPVVVLSGYRTTAWNRHEGGARRSQHVEGRALDLVAPRVSQARLVEAVYARARTAGSRLRGIGLYARTVHLDTRPGDRLVVWRGRTWNTT